jgi:hypothetical protein
MQDMNISIPQLGIKGRPESALALVNTVHDVMFDTVYDVASTFTVYFFLAQTNLKYFSTVAAARPTVRVLLTVQAAGGL